MNNYKTLLKIINDILADTSKYTWCEYQKQESVKSNISYNMDAFCRVSLDTKDEQFVKIAHSIYESLITYTTLIFYNKENKTNPFIESSQDRLKGKIRIVEILAGE